MKEIKLTKGYVALVDDEDYERINKYKWVAHDYASNGRVYAHANIKIGKNNRKMILMHRMIMNVYNHRKVDHILPNGIDNRKCNLRIATQSQNSMNRVKPKKCSSKYKGVHISRAFKSGPKYQATITINKKRIHLGVFPFTPCGELLAALKYDEMACAHFKEFACLNFSFTKTKTPSIRDSAFWFVL